LLLHREIPQYARSLTVFGPTSPLADDPPIGDQAALATVSREWSGIPFYLGREDVRNFEDADSKPFREFVLSHDEVVIVLPKNRRMEDFQALLPKGRIVDSIATRGPARLLRVTTSKTHDRLAWKRHVIELSRR